MITVMDGMVCILVYYMWFRTNTLGSKSLAFNDCIRPCMLYSRQFGHGINHPIRVLLHPIPVVTHPRTSLFSTICLRSSSLKEINQGSRRYKLNKNIGQMICIDVFIVI